jgi:hypothetical protein
MADQIELSLHAIAAWMRDERRTSLNTGDLRKFFYQRLKVKRLKMTNVVEMGSKYGLSYDRRSNSIILTVRPFSFVAEE